MRTVRLIAMIVVLTLLLPASAFAWGNGPAKGASFGTHGWILATGNRFAVSQGTVWVDMTVAAAATAEPDRIKGDQLYHNYDRWGKQHYGQAQKRVASLYAKAVASFRAGDRKSASRDVGLLSHYYADVCEPLHTDDSKGESRMRGPFERAVDSILRTPTSQASWAVYDGFQRVSNASDFTISAAKAAHTSYSTLVKNYNKHGFKSPQVAIARRGVVRAANGVADLIMSIQQDAIEVTSSPEVTSHQGVAVGDGHIFVFDTGKITRYSMSWTKEASTTTPMDGLTGFTQRHLGDGCEHDGKIYVVAENYPAVTNQQILIFDAVTLDRLAAVPTGQTHEVASICVAPGTGGADALWVASYNDSSGLFEYDLDGNYLGEKLLSPVPRAGIQGVTFHDSTFYLAVGPKSGIGYLYSASVEGSTTLLYTRVSSGYHEGIDFDGDRLLWLVDKSRTGSRVQYMRLPAFLSTLPTAGVLASR